MSKTSIVSEEEWVLIIRAKNDPRAFEPLYRRHFRAIFEFIFHRVQDESIASDLTSQVFLKAITKLETYSYRGIPFSSWLFRIAYNQCMEYFRSRKSKRFIVLDEQFQQSLAEESVSSPDLLPLLTQALQSLNSEELMLIELRYFEGYDFKTVSEIAGINESNARVRVHRTLKKLRKSMQL